ncbi:MAG: hypothetical protein K5897_05985 [Eubacterium sp.]|nr:hypothetical protein [Eubacterium sp.]
MKTERDGSTVSWEERTMPSINRIRVNNVKYNFGTQAYDDFAMRLYGQNTLYDLANGGGKSVLMLLLMQCMIPNCTLDDKQPLEKLFRENCGNTTIHSLIEWKLDPADVKDGMRFMTTGFCARKARDRGEEAESRDTASVEYFNYCIFYQEYNKYDLMNLPLSENGERMTYQALKNYLHDLSRRENRIQVFVFDRKGEYQRFISRYGIIDSQWEIIRGINKTEGHVRTYFESNYRTTRKVVEDLLIEEIIEKAYLVKTEQEERQENSAAALLMSIREQLRQLAEKKRDIANYDHEAELIRLLRDRIESFSGLYAERNEVLSGIGDLYLTLDAARSTHEAEGAALQQAAEEAERQADAGRAAVEVLKTAKKEKELEELRARETGLREEAEQTERELEAREAKLNRRRAELDYLDYQRSQKKLQSLLAEAAEEVPEDIAPVVAGIRAFLSEEVNGSRRQAEAVEREKAELEQEIAKARKLMQDARIELAVTQRELAEKEAERQKVREDISRENAALDSPSLTPVEMRLSDAEKELQEAELKLVTLSKEKEKKAASEAEVLQALREKETEAAELTKQAERWRAEEELRRARAVRIAEMEKIYHAENADLRECILEKLSRDISRLSELERELIKTEKRIKEIREGRLLELSEDVAKVMSYITTRHGVTAMFGADYLAQLVAEKREALLIANPELPYGIVVRSYGKLAEDENLKTLDTGSTAVRIYDIEELETPTVAAEHWFSVHQGRAFFLSEDTGRKLSAMLSETAENLRTERSYLTDAVQTEQADLEFLMRESGSLQTADPEEALEDLQQEILSLRKELESAGEAISENAKQILETEALLEKLTARTGALERLTGLEKQNAALETSCGELRKTEQRLQKAITQGGVEEDEKEQVLRGLAESLQQLEIVIHRTEMLWKEQYEPYYKPEVAALREAATLEELAARFRLWKQKMSGVEDNVEKRKLLEQTLTESMERLADSIREHGQSLEKLAAAEAEGKILPGERSGLAGDEAILQDTKALLKQKREALAESSAAVQHLAGSIEYAIENIKAAYGSYEPQPMTSEELERAIPEAEAAKKAAAKRLAEARDAWKAFQKQSQESEGLYREAGRLAERHRIDLAKAKVLDVPVKQMQRDFEDLLLRLDRSEKSLERAKSQMFRTKGQVTQTLMDLGAATLSVSVRDDAEIPGSKEAADSLAKRLTDMEELIRLERSRVEQGLSDMEKLKENFVEQCVERCLDVRTELDKLQNLSQIRMRAYPGRSAVQEEMVQMIRLSIPYVKDEFLRQRMSDHIDRIVEEADSRKTEAEQHKFLQSELALKKLFGVIVTDMNKIRLQLYKRERIREQSRYLKYEEAVGSTGQSQGIYIQFLISVINYISGMYSVEGGGNRTKTIFIDNPFGAAKDIYIWEPIFELLKTNHVQLIVPSRGATPEITGRFDVNYVLGQQMAGGKALTVVTNYSSRTSEENIEYHALEYEQATFDFI